MSRKKISEYRAKSLIYKVLGNTYEGIGVNLTSYDQNKLLRSLDASKTYVVKVDQAVKKRNALGLVRLNLKSSDALKELLKFKKAGYVWALIEEYYPHHQSAEAFFALERGEKGIKFSFSFHGGIHVESHSGKIYSQLVKNGKITGVELEASVKNTLESIIEVFEATHMTYLEVNPLILEKNAVSAVLDAAVEVDTAAQFFIDDAWSEVDFRDPKKELHESERIVEELAATSPSSLSLKVLNKDGSLFLLLSGGGASVVIVDELAHMGLHERIANYGEYSGNPTEEETYLYTKQVLKLLINSSSKQKTLIIAGGVANFTDVAKTFRGVVRAIGEERDILHTQNVEVFVRRGGPNQEAALVKMKNFLDSVGLKNSVNGPEMSLAAVVHEAVKEWKK